MKTYLTQATIASFGQKVAISGGATAVFGGLTANDLAAMGGFVAAIGGLAVQIVFSALRRRDEREEKQQRRHIHVEDTRRKEELHALEVQQRLLNLERLRQEVSGEQA